jgi:hypothetical protein
MCTCAQTLEADVSGTSIRWSYDAVGGVLTLSGLDAVANYRRVLASVRYRNPGSLVPIPGRTPVVNVLTFSPGTRTLTVTLRDGAGGTAVAEATVTCVATARVGTPGRDPALPAAQDCSGNGTIVLDALTVWRCACGAIQHMRRALIALLRCDQGNEFCNCVLGFEGDLCEIPPCLGNGIFSAARASAGYDACTCFAVRQRCGCLRMLAHQRADARGSRCSRTRAQTAAWRAAATARRCRAAPAGATPAAAASTAASHAPAAARTASAPPPPRW